MSGAKRSCATCGAAGRYTGRRAADRLWGFGACRMPLFFSWLSLTVILRMVALVTASRIDGLYGSCFPCSRLCEELEGESPFWRAIDLFLVKFSICGLNDTLVSNVPLKI